MNVAKPRVFPRETERHALNEFVKAAKLADIRPMPWQLYAAETMTALQKRGRGRPAAGARDRWLYPEVAIVVSRQNGKSTLLIPRIIEGLLRGERIMHTAQNRELPRETYRLVASVMENNFRAELAGRPRHANGQEVVRMRNGGTYRIVAPTTAGARGYPNDLVIIDEARELRDYSFVAAAKPTLSASRSPQMLYLSNAGDDGSVVLNALKRRANEGDDRLAYLEWSAAPERPVDDRDGWKEANPALTYTIDHETLEDHYASLPASVFETEHLCRWVVSMAPRLVSEETWNRAEGPTGEPSGAAMGISVAPEGSRASAVIAWRGADGLIGLRLAAEVFGSPIDLDAFGTDLAAWCRGAHVREIGFDPWTDKDLARHLDNAKPLIGQEFTAATERFVNTMSSGALRWEDAGEVGADLAFTSRKYSGAAYQAVRARDDRPVTAAMAAIRAVYLATAPRRAPRLY